MSDLNDVSMAEPDGVVPPREKESAGYSAPLPMDTGNDSAPGAASQPVDDNYAADEPVADGDRTAPDGADSNAMDASTDGAPRRYEDAGTGEPEAGESPEALPTLERIQARAMVKFTSTADGPVASGEDGLGGNVSVAICALVKRAVVLLFEQHRASVCRSPERSDLQLSQEQAFGYLVVDLVLGGAVELLPAEARAIGKRLDFHAAKEKKAHEKAQEAARNKRRNARSAAAKDEGKAAALEQKLADIDAGAEATRAERLHQLVNLELPAANTTVVQARPRPREPAAELAKLGKAAARAEEALMVADCDRVASKRELERAHAAHSQVCKEMEKVSRAQVWAPLETPQSELDSEWQEWVGMQEVAKANIEGLRAAWKEDEKAWCEAEEAAQEARWAVKAEEEACASARQAEQRAAERAAKAEELNKPAAKWAAEAEAAEARAVEARAAEAAAHARIVEIEARIAELELAERAKTRARLHADAEAAWGPGWQSKSPTAVHKL